MKLVFLSGFLLLFTAVAHAENCGGGIFYSGQWTPVYNSYGSECAGSWQSVPSVECGSGVTYRTNDSCVNAPPADTRLRGVVYIYGIPSGASLFVNGKDYSLSGDAPDYRRFVTKALAKDSGGYPVDFQVQYKTAEGKVITAEKDVKLLPGQELSLSFRNFNFQVQAPKVSRAPSATKVREVAPPPPPEDAPGSLKLHMPEEAKIYIDDRLVKLDGPETELTTPDLKGGKRYKYTVRVEYPDVDGNEIIKEKQIFIAAGDKLHLSLDSFKGSIALNGSAPVEQVSLKVQKPQVTK